MAGTGFSQNVNELIRYGIISEDTENKTIALHPLIQEVAIAETIPTVSDCHVMLNHLHLICLAHGLDVKKTGDCHGMSEKHQQTHHPR